MVNNWKRELRGGFCFENAPFASHPSDAKRALHAIAHAVRDGANQNDIEREIVAYLRSRQIADEFITYQIRLFRDFFKSQYREMKNCWLLYKETDSGREIKSIFSGRKKYLDIIYRSIIIFESHEYNEATLFMRAKKKSWPTVKIQPYTYPSGAFWEGKTEICNDPLYIVERGDAKLSQKLDPNSGIIWKPKSPPSDPGPTWEGMTYSERFQR